MTMEQFAKSMAKPENPTPLLQALQDLRSWDLDQLRNHGIRYFCDWAVWPPVDSGTKPELRN